MPETLVNYYKSLLTASGGVLNASTAQTEPLAKSHQFIADVAVWHNVLTPRPEAEVLTLVARESQLAMYALVTGLYRQAFTSLRLAFELAIGTIHFSANRLELAE